MSKTPQFIEFRSAGARLGSNYIGITKNGTISIYAGFYLKYTIKTFTHCLLLLDKEQGLIGLQFGSDDLGDGSYTLNHDTNHKTASISAGNLFKLNGLNTLDWHGKYPPEKFDDEIRKNVFIIDIDKKIITNRKSKK